MNPLVLTLVLGLGGVDQGQAAIQQLPDGAISIPLTADVQATVKSLQLQCPTCATIDINSGTAIWLPPSKRGNKSPTQLDIAAALDRCGVPDWTIEQGKALRQTLVNALASSERQEFEKNEPKDCARQAFTFYMDVAQQLLKNGGRK
jgi:hypothetical protein